MPLLIVESPSKATTIGKYLGTDWNVQASVGHFRDLPGKPSQGIGVDMDTFEPEYEVKNKKVVERLRRAARNEKEIVLATDPDREGEAIAWHIAEVLKLKQAKRVTFSEITPTAVREGVAAPRTIDMGLVAAQEARRVLDRMIGYLVSPKLGGRRSAGRVQSPALRLVVEREHEITSFQATTHYGVRASAADEDVTADWDTSQGLPPGREYVTDQALADRIATTRQLTVVSTAEQEQKTNPPLPFWTSTLQQAASSLLKMRPDDTMKAAQGLYEAGLITYLRTDSPHLAEAAQQAIRDYIRDQGQAVPDTPPTHVAKGNAQEAHECIRPTDIGVKAGGTTEAEQQLYRLIRLRTLASQMMPAVFKATVIHFDSDVALDDGTPARFIARGRVRLVPGWQAVLPTARDNEDDDPDEDDTALPHLAEGQRLSVSCSRLDKSTKPPRRYTEATLTKTLERLGIGRPSTYAAIVSGMSTREYVSIRSRKLHATDTGIDLIQQLCGHELAFMEYGYTEALERDLDEIAGGRRAYFDVLLGAHRQLASDLAHIQPGPDTRTTNDTVPCPQCGDTGMIKRKGKHGAFWGCRHYPDCMGTRPDDSGAPGDPAPATPSAITCPSCGNPMRLRRVKRGKQAGSEFYGCTNYPACRYTIAAD